MAQEKAYANYLPHIKNRWLVEQASWEHRRQNAWLAAQRIAFLLHTTFGVKQVIAFGSLIKSGSFDTFSDIDLAVSGIDPLHFFQAYADAMVQAGDFKVDLIDLANCPYDVRAAILEQGVVL